MKTHMAFYEEWGNFHKKAFIPGFKDCQEDLVDGACFGLSQKIILFALKHKNCSIEEISEQIAIDSKDRYLQVFLDKSFDEFALLKTRLPKKYGIMTKSMDIITNYRTVEIKCSQIKTKLAKEWIPKLKSPDYQLTKEEENKCLIEFNISASALKAQPNSEIEKLIENISSSPERIERLINEYKIGSDKNDDLSTLCVRKMEEKNNTDTSGWYLVLLISSNKDKSNHAIAICLNPETKMVALMDPNGGLFDFSDPDLHKAKADEKIFSKILLIVTIHILQLYSFLIRLPSLEVPIPNVFQKTNFESRSV